MKQARPSIFDVDQGPLKICFDRLLAWCAGVAIGDVVRSGRSQAPAPEANQKRHAVGIARRTLSQSAWVYDLN